MQVHPRYTAPESTERSLSTVPSIATFRSFLLVSIFLWTASLTPQARAQTVQPEEVPLSFAPFHSTGIYNVGETVGWRVTPLEAGSTGKYRYTVRRNNQAILQSGKLDLASGSATIELNASEPEMLLVDVVPDVATPSKSAPQETMVGAAVSPMSSTGGAKTALRRSETTEAQNPARNGFNALPDQAGHRAGCAAQRGGSPPSRWSKCARRRPSCTPGRWGKVCGTAQDRAG